MSKKYKVGYKNPPKEHQWPPGHSGNPSGKNGSSKKAAGAKSIALYLAEKLLEQMSPSVDGKKQKMFTAKAVAKAVIRDLLTAKPREKIFLLRELHAFGVFDALALLIYEAAAEANSGGWLSEEERRYLEIAAECVRLDDEEEDD